MDEYIGIIKYFAGSFAPRTFMFCAGQSLPVQQNAALFSILGTTYGGNGQTTFQLPDLRSRAPIGAGQGPGLTNYQLGQKGGVETAALSINQLPQHNHIAIFTIAGGGSGSGITLNASNKEASQSVPGTAGASTLAAPYYADAPAIIDGYVNDPAPTIPITGITGGGGGITGGTVTVGINGGSLPVSIRRPYLGMNYVITVQGLFPSRN